MCGFGVSNIQQLHTTNYFSQRRGPDLTNIKIINGIQFLHNLLHITGTFTPQPLIYDNVVCVYNGEIYNYKDFGDYSNDSECIIDLYNKHGDEFIPLLDGEFAICLVDFANSKIIIANDTFSCKPLWYEFTEDKFCVASYKSQITGLGLTTPIKLMANTTKVFDLKTLQEIKEYTNFIFDLKQHKTTFDDWLTAFSESIAKRVANTDKEIFLGLSSGYDSGAIAWELKKQDIDFKTYTITNAENIYVLQQRLKILKNTEYYYLDPETFRAYRSDILHNCEDFEYKTKNAIYSIKNDSASLGLASICAKASAEGKRIYLSGQGADEIISDYGYNGEPIFGSISEFGGMFPKNLEEIFPWHNFYTGTQLKYINKEEYIAGHYGIEARYPYLDRQLVQEFLWLTADLKNSKYKSVLSDYLERNNVPYCKEKLGFKASYLQNNSHELNAGKWYNNLAPKTLIAQLGVTDDYSEDEVVNFWEPCMHSVESWAKNNNYDYKRYSFDELEPLLPDLSYVKGQLHWDTNWNRACISKLGMLNNPNYDRIVVVDANVHIWGNPRLRSGDFCIMVGDHKKTPENVFAYPQGGVYSSTKGPDVYRWCYDQFTNPGEEFQFLRNYVNYHYSRRNKYGGDLGRAYFGEHMVLCAYINTHGYTELLNNITFDTDALEPDSFVHFTGEAKYARFQKFRAAMIYAKIDKFWGKNVHKLKSKGII